MEKPENHRRLKRNDVVHPKDADGFFYGRVWRRHDQNHVVVICSGKHIMLYNENDLELSDYKGKWEWQRHPGNEYGYTPRWIRMTSLKKLKKMARDYNASFGGSGVSGRWTKEQRKEALVNPPLWKPRTTK